MLVGLLDLATNFVPMLIWYIANVDIFILFIASYKSYLPFTDVPVSLASESLLSTFLVHAGLWPRIASMHAYHLPVRWSELFRLLWSLIFL